MRKIDASAADCHVRSLYQSILGFHSFPTIACENRIHLFWHFRRKTKTGVHVEPGGKAARMPGILPLSCPRPDALSAQELARISRYGTARLIRSTYLMHTCIRYARLLARLLFQLICLKTYCVLQGLCILVGKEMAHSDPRR